MDTTPVRLLIEYRYDALDRLVGYVPGDQSKGSRFYQRDRLTTEIQGSLQLQMFQSMERLLAESHNGNSQVTSLLMTDQHGSVLTAFGTRSAYTPYGHRPKAGGLTSIMGFNGERADSITGHYLLGNGHRAFNPRLMRFNSPDSLSPFGKGGLNSYAYCGGDPVNRSDPTGRWFGWAWFTSNLVQMAADYLPPLIPQRVARWIPGIANPTLGKWAKHINKVSNFFSGLSYIPVSLIDNLAFTPTRYGIALGVHLGVTALSVASGTVRVLHKIATEGRVPVQLTAVRPRMHSASAVVPSQARLPSSWRAGQMRVMPTASEVRTGIRSNNTDV
ncbi:RHS repeat-associated core domain-containing protein [Pseudomonas sp. NFACC23-1]|uniref:RHS repeat-associated core domain-containing protein n=1 Tax=unclassified Pseudomonas TaxID=196821 RepID=UPI00087E1F0C|nr:MULTISPECIES: RHS repeat-associated core domain-containing protein [unclassified Pseudomonas]SDB37369.1 RHS repeat-associated core domain-containing protein [Pseudomonas sp. NFACC17-2]SEJ54626.1 RHS repeat-associated core domain-containing protein [Pseudomonas sp. NFACC23-1]SFW71969.1 RHS repeat-associated core domain-containing protein [Pseudomonas sp. NFACC16-2]